MDPSLGDAPLREHLQRIRDEWVERGAPVDDIGRLLVYIAELEGAAPAFPLRRWKDVAAALGVSATTLQKWRTLERRWGGLPRRRWDRPDFTSLSAVWDWYEGLRHIRRGQNSPKRPAGV